MVKIQKSTDSASLTEVVGRILDKGIVIDAWVTVPWWALNCCPWKLGWSSPRWKLI
jgi:hypothetical protein